MIALPRALRAMTLGAVLTVGGMTSATMLTGCGGDPQDPATHVEKLSDPVRRGPALKRLKQFYLDAMANDKNDRDGEHVKAVRDKIVEPLSKLILDGKLDTQLTEKGEVLGILADSRDVRALPALIKALEEYKPDDKRPEDYDTRIGEVVLHIGEMVKSGAAKDNKEVNAAMFGLFKRVEAYTLKAKHRGFFRILNNVLLTIVDPAWEGELVGMLNVPIKSAKTKHQKPLMSQVYWQVTASEILGELKSKKAVRPLMMIVMSPFKGNIAGTSMAALVKIGQPSLDAALKVMNGDDDEMKKYAAEEFIRSLKDQEQYPKEDKAKKKVQEEADSKYLDNAVMIVGNMGTKASIAPMLAVLNDAEAKKETKAMVAAQAAKLPKDDGLTEAFKTVYKEAGAADKLANGEFAKEALIEAGIYFFDKDVNEFIFADALDLKSPKKDDVIGVQAGVLSAAIRCATPDQWHYIDKLKEKVLQPIKQAKGKDKFFVKNAKKGNKEEGPFTDKEIVDKILKLELKAGTAAPEPKGDAKKKSWEPLDNFGAFAAALEQARYINAINMGKTVLDECKVNVDCYLKKLTDPEASKAETEMIGIKSAYMVGMLGGEKVKAQLLKMLPTVTSPDARSNIGKIVVRHSPAGDDAAVAELTKWIDAAEKTRDQGKIATVKPYKMIVYVLQNRK